MCGLRHFLYGKNLVQFNKVTFKFFTNNFQGITHSILVNANMAKLHFVAQILSCF